MKKMVTPVLAFILGRSQEKKKFDSQSDIYWLSKSLPRQTSILQTKGFLITSFAIHLMCVIQENNKFNVFTSLISQPMVVLWVLFSSGYEKAKLEETEIYYKLTPLLVIIILLAILLQLWFWGGGWVVYPA